MTKLVAGVVAVAVSLTAVAAVAQTAENKQMAAPAAADKAVRDNILAAAKVAPKTNESSHNSMMAAGSSNAPAAAAQGGAPTVRGTPPQQH